MFDDMITDIMINKMYQAIIKELFIRYRKLNISLVFIRELQNTAINHSADIDYKDFTKINRECTKELYSFLTIDTKFPASDLLRFMKNLLIPLEK